MYIESETKVLYGNHFSLINIIRIGMFRFCNIIRLYVHDCKICTKTTQYEIKSP